MQDKDLSFQLGGLFEEPSAERMPAAEAEPSLESTIIDLLESRPPREVREEKPAPEPAAAPAAPHPPLQRLTTTNMLLSGLAGLITLVLLYLLLRLAPRLASAPLSLLPIAGSYAGVMVIIVLLQWRSHRTMLQYVQEAEQRCAQATCSCAQFETRAEELERSTAELQKHVTRLQTVLQLINSILPHAVHPDELSNHIVELLHEKLDLYYVGLFLSDEAEQVAVLRSGAGHLGRRAVAPGHRVRITPALPLGWCILNAQPRLVSDGRQVTPLIPHARSELALPLRSRGLVLGALSLQSADRDFFSPDDIPALQILADYVAIAIDNARIFAEMRTRLQELEELQRRQTDTIWSRFLSTYGAPSYERTRPGLPPLGEALPSEVEQALVSRDIVINTGNGSGPATLVVPISLREVAIGALGLQKTDSQREWSADEIALIEAIADQMALAIENARLLEETRRLAERERLISEITAHIRASAQVDTILRTAVQELGRALRASEGMIQLTTGAPGEEQSSQATPVSEPQRSAEKW
ncbi:MAG: GAF domain-containing protein [Anaerolineae bacterium]|nr:GAF domain-containing protein [Anaerolineae bacterium]